MTEMFSNIDPIAVIYALQFLSLPLTDKSQSMNLESW